MSCYSHRWKNSLQQINLLEVNTQKVWIQLHTKPPAQSAPQYVLWSLADLTNTIFCRYHPREILCQVTRMTFHLIATLIKLHNYTGTHTSIARCVFQQLENRSQLEASHNRIDTHLLPIWWPLNNYNRMSWKHWFDTHFVCAWKLGYM